MAVEAIFKGRGQFNEITNCIKEELISGAATCELNHCSVTKINNVLVGFLVFEQYYYRSGSYASLALHVIEDMGEIRINAVSGAGGAGLFKISYNAEGAFMRRLTECLKSKNFSVYGEVY